MIRNRHNNWTNKRRDWANETAHRPTQTEKVMQQTGNVEKRFLENDKQGRIDGFSYAETPL